jgi:hypothetical protein
MPNRRPSIYFLLTVFLSLCCTTAQEIQLPIHNPIVTPFLDGDISLSQCPEWLQEYVAFHNANRGTPGAKYLVFTCGEKHWCGGLGKCTCDADLLDAYDTSASAHSA